MTQNEYREKWKAVANLLNQTSDALEEALRATDEISQYGHGYKIWYHLDLAGFSDWPGQMADIADHTRRAKFLTYEILRACREDGDLDWKG